MLPLTSLAALLVATLAPQAPAPRDTAPERELWRLHKFLHPIGEERAELTRSDSGVVITTRFGFIDRMAPIGLAATFRAAGDLTPRHFDVRGNTSRISKIDVAVDVVGGAALPNIWPRALSSDVPHTSLPLA